MPRHTTTAVSPGIFVRPALQHDGVVVMCRIIQQVLSGKDSSEYEMAGGTRTSEIKRGKKKEEPEE